MTQVDKYSTINDIYKDILTAGELADRKVEMRVTDRTARVIAKITINKQKSNTRIFERVSVIFACHGLFYFDSNKRKLLFFILIGANFMTLVLQ